MNDWQLQAFVKVAECGSIGAAAKELFVSSQALQQQINALEGEVGVRLLNRSRRGCVPTAAGVTYLDWARRILSERDAMFEAVRGAAARDASTITVLPNDALVGDALYLDVISDYVAQNPGVSVDLLPPGGALGTVDVSSSEMSEDCGVEFRELNWVPAHCYLVMSAHSPLLGRRSAEGTLSPEDLAGELVLEPPQRLSAGIEPTSVTRLRGLARMDARVSVRGMGYVSSRLVSERCAYLSYGPLQLTSDSLVQVPLADSEFRYVVYIRADASERVADFGAFMKERYTRDWAAYERFVATFSAPKDATPPR
ncbi:MAG: LysR family transcriptional regulator [Coriobacteriia bacterium]|nr:LysR family transcriptional regulator [Coriobacteriia bacterium]MBS5477120.1 LysR family transcriptional regulator [Coriobacteriia bacterium]